MTAVGAEVRENPDQGDDGIEKHGDVRLKVRDGDGDGVEAERDPVLGLGGAVLGGAGFAEAEPALDGEAEQHEGAAGEQERKGVDDDRGAVAFFLKDPGGEEGKERAGEEEEQIAVEDAGVDLLDAVDEQVVIDPVDAGEGEGEQIDEEDGKDGVEAGGAALVRNFELEHHDGDDDGEHAVGEGLKPGWREGLVVGEVGHGDAGSTIHGAVRAYRG